MKPAMRNTALFGGALVGVPIVFGAYVFASYRLALRQGYLPFTLYPEWYWFAVYGTCLVAGTALIYFTKLAPHWLRIIAGIVYATAMSVGLLLVHLVVACANGDCL